MPSPSPKTSSTVRVGELPRYFPLLSCENLTGSGHGAWKGHRVVDVTAPALCCVLPLTVAEGDVVAVITCESHVAWKIRSFKSGEEKQICPVSLSDVKTALASADLVLPLHDSRTAGFQVRGTLS